MPCSGSCAFMVFPGGESLWIQHHAARKSVGTKVQESIAVFPTMLALATCAGASTVNSYNAVWSPSLSLKEVAPKPVCADRNPEQKSWASTRILHHSSIAHKDQSNRWLAPHSHQHWWTSESQTLLRRRRSPSTQHHSLQSIHLCMFACYAWSICCDLCIPTTSVLAPWHSKLSWSCWASKSRRIYYMEIWCNMQWSGNPNRCGSKFRHKEPQNRPCCNQTGSESIILNRSRSWNYLGFRYRNHPQSGFH